MWAIEKGSLNPCLEKTAIVIPRRFFFEHMPWVDSFLNASMILSGMGPATTMTTTAGKLFAGLYALFSGLAFIAIVVIMLSPIIHKLFRKIHIESGKPQD